MNVVQMSSSEGQVFLDSEQARKGLDQLLYTCKKLDLSLTLTETERIEVPQNFKWT